MNKEIVISVKTILLTILMILAGYVVYRLGPIIGIFAIATLLTISLESLVKYLMKLTVFNKPLKRNVAVIISYFLLIVVIALVGSLGVPPVISQFQKMIASLSQYAQELHLSDGFSLSLKDFIPQAANASSEVLTVTISIFSNLTTLFSIFVISIYMSLDWENLKKRFAGLFPEKLEDDVKDTIAKVETNVGQWMKGELVLMLVVGFFSFLGLFILNVKYPVALGIVAGIMEIVPMIGPIISAIIAGIIAFADAPIKGLGVIALFIIVQQLENNLLVPKIMQKVSGFSPLIILLSLLVGSEFFGVVGAIVAVPTTMILSIVLRKFLLHSD